MSASDGERGNERQTAKEMDVGGPIKGRKYRSQSLLKVAARMNAGKKVEGLIVSTCCGFSNRSLMIK